MSYRPKHVIEYILLRTFVFFLRVLPYRAALFIAWLNARLAYACFTSRVKETKRRIRTVFGDKYTEKEVAQIAWDSWRNIIFSSVETIRLDKMTPGFIKKAYTTWKPVDVMVDHSRTGKGAIIVTYHMGSWEMAALAIHQQNVPVFSIAARQKNPLINSYLNSIREAPGIPRLTRGAGTMRTVLRKLRQGGFLAILPDVRMKTPGIKVPFLGGEANVGPGAALFARHENVPIFPVVIHRRGWTTQDPDLHEPIYPDMNLDKDTDVERITKELFKIIEAAIYDDPGQWFWFNKRWILDPISRDKSEKT